MIVVFAMLLSASVWAQKTFKGKVVDAATGESIPGVNIQQEGTTNGVYTDIDGKFTIALSKEGYLTFTYVGYTEKKISFNAAKGTNLGVIELEQDALGLDEVVVIGVADIAKDRQTPVAVSTIKVEEIVEKLGTKEFPEILRSTPSVYATKKGGGFGDSRINLRGFDQRNTAVMINGMPVNDMENGKVYWSNWAGLSDVTSAMQVQRGLGSSKLAISSVGGTINILTRSANKRQGGSLSVRTGNDDYIKMLASYNSGMMDNGFSVSTLFGRTSGNGYVEGTKFEGYSYYLALGYRPNDKHDFQFTVTGAPQRHNGRGYAPSLSDYIRYGGGTDPNIKYNGDYGYRNGEEDTFGGNFYHKPVASLNWDWKLGEKSKLSTVLYASLGRGGSVGSIGRINGKKSYQLKDENGHVRFDDIIAWNQGKRVQDFGGGKYNNPYSRAKYDGLFMNTGDNGFPRKMGGKGKYGSDNGISQRSSMNSHNWIGIISNFDTKLSETLTLDLGIDLRTYKGIHYRRLVDYMGADGYMDFDNINYPEGRRITETYAPTIGNVLNVFKNVDDEQKIDYHNDGRVRWLGAFGQLEYQKDDISMFVQGAVSSNSYKRIDYFNYKDNDPKRESAWETMLGGNIKGGINWNINEHHNVFGNAGYYLRQPNFRAVFPSYNDNHVNDDLQNEKVIGLELGYGFRSENIRFNVNLYRTSWADRFMRKSAEFTIKDNVVTRGTADLQGVEQVHMGVEFDGTLRISDNFKVYGMLSVGNYEYASNVEAAYFDESNKPIVVNGVEQKETLYLDGVKVGDAAQVTGKIGFDWKFAKGFKLDLGYFYADKLYANIDADSFNKPNHDGSLELPSDGLLDGGLSFREDFGKNQSITIRLNFDNILDQTYISESATNVFAKPGDKTWKGVNTRNRVFFGWGRTWNLSATYRF